MVRWTILLAKGQLPDKYNSQQRHAGSGYLLFDQDGNVCNRPACVYPLPPPPPPAAPKSLAPSPGGTGGITTTNSGTCTYLASQPIANNTQACLGALKYQVEIVLEAASG